MIVPRPLIRWTYIVLVALAFLGGAAGFPPAISETIESKILDEQIAKLYRDGRYSEAIPLAQQLLALREEAVGPDHPEVASASATLANLYYSQGRYPDAELLYKRSLSILEHSLGPTHPYVARSLSNLALLYVSQARSADAEVGYKRSLAIFASK